jgi:hypothetical protein
LCQEKEWVHRLNTFLRKDRIGFTERTFFATLTGAEATSEATAALCETTAFGTATSGHLPSLQSEAIAVDPIANTSKADKS